jgi:hypothetical protein
MERTRKKVQGVIISFLCSYSFIFASRIHLNAETDQGAVRILAESRIGISAAEARSFIKKLEAICNLRDINSYIQTFADDLEVVGIVGEQKLVYSREQFIARIRESWGAISNYSYKFEILNLDISGRLAVVKGKEIEKTSVPDGSFLVTESITTITLEKINGVIKQKFIESIITKLS